LSESVFDLQQLIKLFEGGFLQGRVIQNFNLKVPGTSLSLKGRIIEFDGGACILQTRNVTEYFKNRSGAVARLEELKEPYERLIALHRDRSHQKGRLETLKRQLENAKSSFQQRKNELEEQIKKAQQTIRKLDEDFAAGVKALSK